MSKIYVASSWRCERYESVLAALRRAGHECYDFKNPAPGDDGFKWRELDPDFATWTPQRFVECLSHEIAQLGFANDKGALDWCDTLVLVLPCGRSAHLEAGYVAGRGKRVFVLLSEKGFEPELMYLLCAGVFTDLETLLAVLDRPNEANPDHVQALALAISGPRGPLPRTYG